MRILSIGHALPHPDIDNYNVFTAPSLFDYDIVSIDPANMTDVARQLVEHDGAYEAIDGRPVVNAASTASGVSAADQVRRRAEEAQRFLEAGGILIVAGRPNATQAGIVGFEGLDRYSWLPAPAGVSWAPPFLRAAEGRTVRVVADDHPFGDFLRDHRGDLAYRATFDERQAPLRQAGRVIATGGGNAPIAVEFKVLAGTVLFLPAFSRADSTNRTAIAMAFVDCARRMLGGGEEEDAPFWSRSVAVPGLEQVDAELEEAQTTATQAAAKLEAVREKHEHLAGYRRILWDEGRRFDRAVLEAFRELGFTILSQPGEPLVVESEGRRAFVEAASSRDQIVEWPYVHLQRRLEEQLLTASEQLKGIVVVNGHRTAALDQRKPQFTDPLRIACENYRYTLITTETLFALVQRALGGADAAELTGVQRRLMGANGLLERDVATGEAEEQESGPIF